MRISLFLSSIAAIALTACGGSHDPSAEDAINEKADKAIEQADTATNKSSKQQGLVIPDGGVPSAELQAETKKLKEAQQAADFDTMNDIQAARKQRNAAKKQDFDGLLPTPSDGWTIEHPNTRGSVWQTSGGDQIYTVYYMKDDGEVYSAPWKQPHIEINIYHVAQSMIAGNTIWAAQNGRIPEGGEVLTVNDQPATKIEDIDDGDPRVIYTIIPNTQTLVRFTGTKVSDAETRTIIDQIDFDQLAEITTR